MNDIEYFHLLKSSPTFNGYSEEQKLAISKATGENRQSFVAIFLEEASERQKAAENYVNGLENAVLEVKFKAQNRQINQTHRQETAMAQQDLNSAEELLHSL